ncbi:uncharacterized protein LOC141903967 [Tubulanus polymorphus]|uniref:uncharacterized protein LOC141903967 n=1 Tax=Tubulanus polymorphus TaxID=672921 RepID=UPI003DA22BE0
MSPHQDAMTNDGKTTSGRDIDEEKQAIKDHVITAKTKGLEIGSTYVRLAGIMAALLYGGCSMSMAFVNKALLSTYEFKFPASILAFQMTFVILILSCLNVLGHVKLPPLSVARCRGFLLPSMFYASNAVLGLTALSSMNIPMYGVIKRMAPLAILVLGIFMLDKGRPSKRIVIAILLMTGGCILAGYGDLTFNLYAYACGLGSSLTQAMYLTLVQKHSDKLTVAETLQLISINTLPVLILWAIFKRELTGIMNFFEEASTVPLTVYILISLMISVGALLNYSMFLCTTYNSALTTSVVGIIKSVLSTIIGMFSFGGVAVNTPTAIGIGANLVGGVLYTIAKYHEQNV